MSDVVFGTAVSSFASNDGEAARDESTGAGDVGGANAAGGTVPSGGADGGGSDGSVSGGGFGRLAFAHEVRRAETATTVASASRGGVFTSPR